MQRLAYFLCVVGLLSSALVSHGAEPFKANDRVAFVGDSITHGGSYHTFIQTFYATSYPNKGVLCFNVGISGDNAQGGYQRASSKGDGIWENDVARYRPTTATVMLGMNDVGGWQFESSKDLVELNKQNAQQLEWYSANYKQLLDNLEALALQPIILIKSSPYDQTMVSPDASKNLYRYGKGKNDLIIEFGKEVIDREAIQRKYSVVDFNTAMLAINAEQQANDPAYSIIGNDRVHPGITGHMVMAYTFLKAQGLEGPVARVALDVTTEALLSKENCSVSNLQIESDAIAFDYMAASLPFPIQPYAAVSDVIDFETEFNQELITARGLQDGSYGLEIDGVDCGTFTSDQFESGVNLATLPNAPQVTQAAQVHEICKQRAKISDDIRTVVWSVGYLSKIKGHDCNDYDANVAMIARIENGETPEGVWGTPSNYVKSLLRRYVDLAKGYDARIQELESLSAPLYEAAQPKMRRIVITQV